MHERSLARAKGPVMSFAQKSAGFRRCRAGGLNPRVDRNPQARREGWQHVLWLTATSCGLLKQPDKQEAARSRFDFCTPVFADHAAMARCDPPPFRRQQDPWEPSYLCK